VQITLQLVLYELYYLITFFLTLKQICVCVCLSLSLSLGTNVIKIILLPYWEVVLCIKYSNNNFCVKCFLLLWSKVMHDIFWRFPAEVQSDVSAAMTDFVWFYTAVCWYLEGYNHLCIPSYFITLQGEMLVFMYQTTWYLIQFYCNPGSVFSYGAR
jgi:hypothetical protein